MLARIKARRKAIGDGMWLRGADRQSVISCDPEPDPVMQEHYGGRVICETVSGANQEFIVHAPSDVDWLIAKAEQKMSTLQALWILFCCGLMLCGIAFFAAFMCGLGWRMAQ